MDSKDMSGDKVTLRDIYEAVNGLREDIAEKYVTKDAFEPVRNIVYGLVAVVLLAVAGAIVALVVHASQSPIPTPTTTVKVAPGDN